MIVRILLEQRKPQMLVIVNGAPKGGSTWVTQILNRFGHHQRVPEQYQNPKWVNSSIERESLDTFLSEANYSTNNYICKQHWRDEDFFLSLLGADHIRIINIIRDLKDVVVSRYFHDLRLNKVVPGATIDEYYFEGRGKRNAQDYIRYQLFWHGDAVSPQPFLACYERLHVEYLVQVRELVDYAGLEGISDSEILRVRAETSFESKANTGQGEFFRKGIVGDWRNHLSAEILSDIEMQIDESGYDAIAKRVGLKSWVDQAERICSID